LTGGSAAPLGTAGFSGAPRAVAATRRIAMGDDEMANRNVLAGWFWMGALLGGAVGMALGFLSAPRPGADTRQALVGRLKAARPDPTQAGAGGEAVSAYGVAS
jgi:hypothetical protein